MTAKILYAEDDDTLGFVTQDNLSENGFDVTHCTDGNQALKAFKSDNFDICVFDVMMPKKDGFELAKAVRKLNSEIPIIFLTAKSMKEDRIEGLTIGGDDYITKPFSIEELILKIEIFLKRKSIVKESMPVVKIRSYTFDHDNLMISHKNFSKKLTQKEADLFKLLVENKNNIVRREEILTKVWGKNDYFLGRSMDVFISRLRKYLKEDDKISIENLHGIGFKMNVQ